jgi:DNA-directed RNA polymerase omega subunit
LEESHFLPETEIDVDWITEIDSKYRLVLLAAKRSKQLQRGAKPRIYSSAKKTTRVALEEVRRGLVRYQPLVKPLKAD